MSEVVRPVDAWKGRGVDGVYREVEQDEPAAEPTGLQISINDLISVVLITIGSVAAMGAGGMWGGAAGVLAVFGGIALVLGVIVGLSDR